MREPTELCLDVSDEQARALHRIVRAMHDGHCPCCGHLAPAEDFNKGDYHWCPECGFLVTQHEARAALKAFQPVLHRSLEVFREWRGDRRDER